MAKDAEEKNAEKDSDVTLREHKVPANVAATHENPPQDVISSSQAGAESAASKEDVKSSPLQEGANSATLQEVGESTTLQEGAESASSQEGAESVSSQEGAESASLQEGAEPTVPKPTNGAQTDDVETQATDRQQVRRTEPINGHPSIRDIGSGLSMSARDALNANGSYCHISFKVNREMSGNENMTNQQLRDRRHEFVADGFCTEIEVVNIGAPRRRKTRAATDSGKCGRSTMRSDDSKEDQLSGQDSSPQTETRDEPEVPQIGLVWGAFVILISCSILLISVIVCLVLDLTLYLTQ